MDLLDSGTKTLVDPSALPTSNGVSPIVATSNRKKTEPIPCVLNGGANSNRAREARESLPKLFAQHGMNAEVILADAGCEIPMLAQRAVKEGATLVVAGGGDGTVNGVASALTNTKAALGVLPLGTLNHFAKDLKIPLELEAAVANLSTGTITCVDAGEVNGRYFLNNSSLGLYPTIVRQREAMQSQGHGKWLAFVEAVAYALLRYSRLYVSLQPNDQNAIEGDTPFVFVGNNRYETSGSHIGERERLDGGRIWIYCARHASRAELLRLALQSLRGKQDPNDLEVFDTDELWIRNKKSSLNVAIDGEVTALRTPLHYRIHPRALRVIVPANRTQTPF